MYSYFDKHGKKLIAIFGSLLILVFLLPAGFGTGGGGASGRFGKVDGHRIQPEDLQRAQNTLRSLDRLVVPGRGPNQPEGRVTQFIFRNGLDRQLEQNPVLYYLLLHEADRAGAVVSDTEVESFLRAPVQFTDGQKLIDMDKVNPTIKEGLRYDLQQALSVMANFRRIESAIKVSRPLVDDAVARESQQIRARVAVFTATDYDKQVPTPTDDELKRQFAAYADVAPAVTDNNPFGFGYRVPDRLAVQWLGVLDADVAKAVEASKSAELWDEDAIIYYQRNPSEFAKTIPPATQPTTQPFAAVRDEVLRKLRAPLIESQKRAVANRIVQQLTTLNGTVKSPATAPAAQSAEPAYAFDALKAIADAIQKQTGVRPVAVAPAGVLSRADLEKQPGFGKAFTAERGNFATGPDYLFDSIRALKQQNDTSATGLDVGQPSPVFIGDDGLYVARVVGVEPAHPARSIDEVKTQVEKDVRQQAAFKIAADSAQATLDKAQSAGGLDKAGVAVQTSDFFAADAPSPAGLTGDYAAGLVGPAFEALRGVSSASALPVRTVAKLRRDGRAAVVEVFDVKTTLNTTIEEQARLAAERQIAVRTVPPGIVEQWFNFDAVAKRVNYVPDAVTEEPAAPNRPAGPANPFMPG